MEIKINIPQHNLGSYTIPDECVKGVCVDIGANVGSFTLAQASFFSIVHYYEPFQDCYDIITQKLEGFKNVTGWREAAYSEDGKTVAIMAHDNLDAGSNAIKTDAINEAWTKEIGEVLTVSLPTVLKRAGGHINYLKVDCETSEYHFLLDQDLIEIDYIGIELHWQMGKKKYDCLGNHLLKTHTASKELKWEWGVNQEVLLKRKGL